MSDTIIAALDLDAPAQARDAAAYATWLADSTDCALVAVTIFAARAGSLAPQLERRRRGLASHFARPVETVTIAGTSPARLLHELGDQRHPRAIVIGSSRSGAQGVVSVGSVGELLLHGGSAPIVVTPPGFHAREAAAATLGVAFGGTPESLDAVRIADRLAADIGACLRVLTVSEPEPPYALGAQHLQRALAGAPAERVELTGDPARTLAAASADLDLLVVGSRSYGPLGAVLLGAVTRRLVYAAACPIMVVPRLPDPEPAVAPIGGMEAAVDA